MNGKKAKLIRKAAGYRSGMNVDYARAVMKDNYTWTDNHEDRDLANMLGLLFITREQAISAGVPDNGDGASYCVVGAGPVINSSKSKYNLMKREASRNG